MTKRFVIIGVLTLSVVLGQALCVFAFEQTGRFATLRYASMEALREFNDELYLGGSLGRMLRKKKLMTVEAEALAKVEILVEKAQVVLDMFPDNMHITVVILADAEDVRRVYKQRYGRSARHIAYYSLKEDTIYISADDTSLEVISHEIGHAVVDHYFKVRPPYNIHELMAQFTSKHIQD